MRIFPYPIFASALVLSERVFGGCRAAVQGSEQR